MSNFSPLRWNILKEKNFNAPELDDESLWVELGFQADIYAYFNHLNLDLQGKCKLITDLRDKIKSFKMKLQLFKVQLSTDNFANFPSVKIFSEALDSQLREKFIDSLTELLEEFNSRFSDLDLLSERFQFFTSPFTFDPMSPQLPVSAEELIDLQCDSAWDDAQKRIPINAFWIRLHKAKGFQIYVALLQASFVCLAQPTTVNVLFL